MVLFEADEALVDDHCVGHDLLYGDDEAAQKATQAVHSGVEQVVFVECDRERGEVEE